MKFEFSIRTALKDSWRLFAAHPAFFLVLSLVMLVLNVVSQVDNWIINILVSIAAVVWSYVFLSAVLAAVDGKTDMLRLSVLERHLPTFRLFLKLIGVGLVAGLITVVGFILLIIPGIYFMTRLVFANLSLVDRKGSIRQSLRFSWYLVKKEVFWTVFLTMVVSVVLAAIGIALIGVGFLVAYPVVMLMIAKLYRALIQHQPAHEVVPQPAAIQAHTEPEPVQE